MLILELGDTLVLHIFDDSCLQGPTFDKCLSNIHDIIQLMDSLGLTVNLGKSVIQPTQQIVFLGFLLCSVTMSVRLPSDRCRAVIELCQEVLRQKRVTIRKFAKLIGKLVATEPGIEYAPLYYKPLEKIKDKELKIHKGNFDSFMTIPAQIVPIIIWWINNINSGYKLISHGPPAMILFSDASTKAWGAYNKTHDIRTGGEWTAEEQRCHINNLELQACQFALKAFCKNVNNIHVQVFMDNTTSCSYIEKFGGRSEELDLIARDIWFWCLEREIHLSVAHVPGVDNTEADEESRKVNDDTEWSLTPKVFDAIKNIYPQMSVDLFASRNNNKLSRYVSRRPDPEAYAIDAFSLTWANDVFYMFPPFSLIGRILQKVQEEGTEAVIVAPIWTTQSWWPSLLSLICGKCYQVQKTRQHLYLPHDPDREYPIKKMNLGVFYISGRNSKTGESNREQETSFCNPGEMVQSKNTMCTSTNGLNFASQKVLTPFIPNYDLF